MFPAKSLLSLLLIAVSFTLSVATSPTQPNSKFSLAFAGRINTKGYPNIAEADRARAKAMISQVLAKPLGLTKRNVFSIEVTNTAVTYTANVGVGNPPTEYKLLIDTGSSNTWVGSGGKPYVVTGSSRNTTKPVFVSYGSGNFSGIEFIDTVSLSLDLLIPSQSIGVASTSSGFDDVNGILGVGPVDLTNKTLVDSPTEEIPTVTDNLYKEGIISTEKIGIYYAPTTNESNANGEITFGGVDSTKFTGEIAYVPITSTSPASEFWGIDQSVTYGSTSILSSTAGIVDTGTTLILLATEAFDVYSKVTGGTLDATTGLLRISPAQYDALKPLKFHIGSTTYSLSPNGQIWPRTLNAAIHGDPNSIYLIVDDIGSKIGKGLDFINGFTFLERFYSVYDTTNQQVGFATTAMTDATSN